MATTIEVLESGPLSASFLVSWTGLLPDQLLRANAWSLLPNGPLKSLLMKPYITSEGDPDNETFLRESCALGFEFSYYLMGRLDGYTFVWRIGYGGEDVAALGEVALAELLTGDAPFIPSMVVHLSVMHSITK